MKYLFAKEIATMCVNHALATQQDITRFEWHDVQDAINRSAHDMQLQEIWAYINALNPKHYRLFVSAILDEIYKHLET